MSIRATVENQSTKIRAWIVLALLLGIAATVLVRPLPAQADQGVIDFLVDSPGSLDAAGDNFSPNPFTITATMSNIGNAAVENVVATLTLHTGLHTDDPTSVSLGTIAVGESKSTSWRVMADPQAAGTTVLYDLTVTGSNGGIGGTHQLTLPALAGVVPPNVVAWLGDSYSSGEGVPPFVDGTNIPQNRCHRSTRAYGMRLNGKPGFPNRSVFVACSGALVENFHAGRGQWSETEGQLQHLDVRDKIVAFTIGGNDIGFPEMMKLCLTVAANCQLNDPLVKAAIAELEPRLASLYTEVLSEAPRAQVFVLGYPHLFSEKIALRCRVGLQPAESRWVNAKVDELNAAIKDAIEENDNARLHYVDTTTAFQGGEACSAKSQFMNEIVPQHLEYSFHPTADGQSLLAARLAHAVRRQLA
jgi:lysophospholipase L1-like esterase